MAAGASSQVWTRGPDALTLRHSVFDRGGGGEEGEEERGEGDAASVCFVGGDESGGGEEGGNAECKTLVELLKAAAGLSEGAVV